MTPLYHEIHRWAALPFIWGETDCMLVLADWIERVHGVDTADHLRLAYDDFGSCQRVSRFFTDPEACVEGCVSKLGLARADDPVAGDIGLLRLPDEKGRIRPFGGLWLGEAWAVKAPQGVTTLHSKVAQDVLAIWAVGYEGQG